jgi:hypothetical protein
LEANLVSDPCLSGLLIQAPGGERWRSGSVAREALGPGGVGGVQDLAAGSVGLLAEAVVDGRRGHQADP